MFKFFGNRPNLLAFQNNAVIDQFNRQLVSDQNLKLDEFDRPIDQSYEAFVQAGFDHRKLFPTFGRVVNEWLTKQGVGDKQRSEEEQWEIIQNVVKQLEQPTYYLTVVDYKPTLSLLPVGDIKQTFTDPLEAANYFYSAYNRLTTFDQERAHLIRLLEKRRKRASARIEANLQRLTQRESEVSHEEMGHILMANLHEVPIVLGAMSPERLTLYDFYRDQPITLKLKPDLSPQKNAENFYRKAKNEKIEEQYMLEQMMAREADILKIDSQKADLEAITSLKDLRRYVKQQQIMIDDVAGRADDATPLFKEVVLDTFRILIGRNAKNNDLLTQKYAYKEDLWLHARDVAGSHVIVKYQAGKAFPKNVIERAAELAAWYSKRRNDSLCPVTVTPRKFVRKPKGLAEGQVVVDKEDVVLVVPRGE
ncbi:NFACT RNA binding domain-containing protein [Spirosoma flavus]